MVDGVIAFLVVVLYALPGVRPDFTWQLIGRIFGGGGRVASDESKGERI